MENRFYRLCYTRVGGNSSESGWQLVNVEEGTPASLQGIFENTEKTNEVIGDQPKNADGSPARMFEIVEGDAGGEACVGMAYVQYGLSDAWGRAHFFSSGFMAEGAYELLKKPHRLLGIAESNFRFTEEETAGRPDPLRYDPEITEKDVFARYSVTKEQYLTLVKCVYFMLFNPASSTLHVKTDGTDAMARALLCLIYHALPYSLRTRVTAATLKTQATGKMFLFTDRLPEFGYRLDFADGSNNVLTPEFEERLSRYSFALHYPSSVTEDDGDGYFDSLEKILGDIGNVNEQDMLSLQLIHQTVTADSVSDDDLIGMLYDWLRMSETVGLKAEKYICAAMEEVLKRGVRLSRDNIRLLEQFIVRGVSDRLRIQYIRYTAFDLLHSGWNEASVHMNRLAQSPELFAAVRSELGRTGEGVQLIRAYYSAAADGLLKSPDCGYEGLVRFWQNCDQRADLAPIHANFVRRIEDLSRGDIRSQKPFYDVYRTAASAFAVVEPSRNTPEGLVYLYDEFDLVFRTNFTEAKYNEYHNLYAKKDVAMRYPRSAALVSMLDCLRQYDYGPVTEYLKSGCAAGGPVTPEERDTFAGVLFDFALHHGAADQCQSMEFWHAFAVALNRKLVPLMVRNNVALLANSDLLQRSVNEDQAYWTDENLRGFYQACLDYDNAYPDNYIISKRTGDILYNAIKAKQKSQKQAEKMQRQAEKEQRQTEREPGKQDGAPGFIQQLIGRINRKQDDPQQPGTPGDGHGRGRKQ